MKRVVIFFFSRECLDDMKLIVPHLKGSDIKFWYYFIYAPDERFEIKGERNCFLDYEGFYTLLTRDSKKISKYIGSNVGDLKSV